MVNSQWNATVDELRKALVSGTSSGGVELEGETTTNFGASSLVAVVEAAGSDTATQIEAYKELCAVLDKHLINGASQVLGCLVVEGTPDPDALLTGLQNMLRSNGTFTPVLALSIEQANQIVESGIALLDLIDPATALLEVAASRTPVTHEVAATALVEIDELVARQTEPE